MSKSTTPIELPIDLVRLASALVASGRFASLEAVLRAGVEALSEEEGEWLAYAREAAREGFAALDRGEGISAGVDEHLAAIDDLADA